MKTMTNQNLPLKYFLSVLLFSGCMQSFGINNPDTALNVFNPVTMNRDIKATGFLATIKGGIAAINRDSLDQGIHLLLLGLNQGHKEIQLFQSAGYDVNELAELLQILSKNKLSADEKTQGYTFIKAVNKILLNSSLRELNRYLKIHSQSLILISPGKFPAACCGIGDRGLPRGSYH
jgi:hypothetical protein